MKSALRPNISPYGPLHLPFYHLPYDSQTADPRISTSSSYHGQPPANRSWHIPMRHPEMLDYASALVSSFSNVRARRVPKKNASPPLPFTLLSLNRITPLCPGLSPQHMAASSHSLRYARNKNSIPAMLGASAHTLRRDPLSALVTSCFIAQSLSNRSSQCSPLYAFILWLTLIVTCSSAFNLERRACGSAKI